MQYKTLWLMMLALIFSSLVLSGETWEISSTAELYHASSNAGVGDVLLVAPGTYLLTQPVIVRMGQTMCSSGGRNVTILDGQYKTLCVNMGLPAPTKPILQGFTILRGNGQENGVQKQGGGVKSDSYP